MKNIDKKEYILDAAGLMGIGLFSLGYVIFVRFFAELHLQLPFLNFPIFVGEILLFGCLILFLVKYYNNPQKLTKWHYLIICYFVFVVIKALYGYVKWGPLALRHAALLYYPAFIVFGYAFYRRKFFDWKAYNVLPLLIILIFVVGKFNDYWTFTLAVLGFILIKSHSHKIIKSVMFLVFFVAIPYKVFFVTSRMMIVANLMSGIYLAGILPIILSGKKWFKFLIAVMIGGVVLLGLFTFANHNALKSIVEFKRMAEVFNSRSKEAESKISHFKAERRREVKVYNPERIANVRPDEVSFAEVKKEIEAAFVRSTRGKQVLSKESTKAEVRQVLIEQVKKEIEIVPVEQMIEKQELSKESTKAEVRQVLIEQVKKEIKIVLVEQVIEKQELSKERTKAEVRQVLIEQVKEKIEMASIEQTKEEIPLALIEEIKEEMRLDFEEVVRGEVPVVSAEQVAEPAHYNDNAIFRLFIWRDMLVDLANESPILGFDFGKPFRSKSLEVIHWGDGDWARDGWIAAHNSYLHIIYRMGIVGIILIVCFLTILFHMIKEFISAKSLTGVLLCGIIINWFAAANFLLIFELPYTAIPIWTLFGLTYAYFSELKLSTNN